MSELTVPALSLVVLVGISGSGKTTFARSRFAATEVLSSDAFRAMVGDDENDQSVTAEAFDALHYVAAKRLAAGRLTVIDATNVQPEARRSLIGLARDHDVLPVAIVLDLPLRLCARRNEDRADRDFGVRVLKRQQGQLRHGLNRLRAEGFRVVHTVRSAAEVDAAQIVRTPMWSDLRDEHGPFDVIGDVHGCLNELVALLGELGYTVTRDEAGRPIGACHPTRRAVFVGDLVDRGPDVPGVLRLVCGMVRDAQAFAVAGNHDDKLLRALRGRPVQVSHGLAESLEQLAGEPEGFRQQVESFLDGLVSHYQLDGGRLVVAHAGLTEKLQGRASRRVRSFCLYGQTTGETDEFGLPVRQRWAADYRGRAMVLYGHTPVTVPLWENNTLCLDTGCVFGGSLTALRYPERELVSVPAGRVYYQPARPLSAPAGQPGSTAATRHPQILDIGDVFGRRVETRHHGRISVRRENAAGALEVISRFAVDPRWLVYLPPTMSPVPTSADPDLLEHPAEAFSSYREAGVQSLICQEKHMGSRAVVLICRDIDTARSAFGAPGGDEGAVWTRTGRPFFAPELSGHLLQRVRRACETAGLFEEFGPWLLFDTELLPWSAKAGDLLRDQYARVGAAARAGLGAAGTVLAEAAARGLDVTELRERTAMRAANAEAFTRAYRRHCWATDGLHGVRLAPFQLLAAADGTHYAADHAWHLQVADRLVAVDELFITTRRMEVTVDGEQATSQIAAATRWWQQLTDSGGEGMVVKPAAGIAYGRSGLAQPGLKVRGREYLRISYGPDYTLPQHIARLKNRSLGHKRSMALREHALGLEALDRLAAGEPLWRVHECVFAVLACESEPVDPRL